MHQQKDMPMSKDVACGVDEKWEWVQTSVNIIVLVIQNDSAKLATYVRATQAQWISKFLPLFCHLKCI